MALGLYVANGGDADKPDLRVVRKHLKAAKIAVDELGASAVPDLCNCARWLGTKPDLNHVSLDMVREDLGKWRKLGRPAEWKPPQRSPTTSTGAQAVTGRSQVAETTVAPEVTQAAFAAALRRET